MPIMEHWQTEEEVEAFKPSDHTLRRNRSASPAGRLPHLVCPRPRGPGTAQTWWESERAELQEEQTSVGLPYGEGMLFLFDLILDSTCVSLLVPGRSRCLRPNCPELMTPMDMKFETRSVLELEYTWAALTCYTLHQGWANVLTCGPQ